jgi:hypothetical protein
LSITDEEEGKCLKICDLEQITKDYGVQERKFSVNKEKYPGKCSDEFFLSNFLRLFEI